jgi:hypothetical protein
MSWKTDTASFYRVQQKGEQAMAYVNGATDHGSASAIVTPPAAVSTPQAQPKSVEEMTKIRARLAEPFDPAEIKWRVTATTTTQTKRGLQKRGQLVAYTDQRAYTDRLNDVFGEWGWTRTYNAVVLADELVSVEAARVEQTYQVLIVQHRLERGAGGKRPIIQSSVLFRGIDGRLTPELLKQGLTPEFFTRAGEVKPIPAPFIAAVSAVT